MVSMNSKPMFGRAKKQTLRRAKQVKKHTEFLEKMKRKQQKSAELVKTRKQATEADLYSKNPVKRAIAQKQQMSEAKQAAKLRELEAKVKTAELAPEIAAQQARTESRVKVAKAQAAGKFAGYSALGTGAARLGQGLSDERNQDDDKNRQQKIEELETIVGSDGEGLQQGVL